MPANMGAHRRATRRTQGLVNLDEAAEMLKVTRRTVINWRLKGGILPKEYPVFTHRCYKAADIAALSAKMAAAKAK